MPPGAARLTIPSRRDAAAEVIGRVMSEVEESGFVDSDAFAIRLALEEAVSNAMKHGNAGDESKQLTIEYAVSSELFAVDIEDSGCGFDPGHVPDPTLDENLEVPSGRGLMLMRAYMTHVSFNETGNRVSLRYRPSE